MERLAVHVDRCEFEAAETLLSESIGGIEAGALLLAPKQRKQTLDILRKARRFPDLGRLAQTLMRAGHDTPGSTLFDPHVRRQYAQSLIECGQLAGAIDSLHAGLSLIAGQPGHLQPDHDAERREMLGLLGRAHKQAYVDQARNLRGARARPNPELLRASMMWYNLGQYGLDAIDGHWHLVNLIALTARAKRDDVATTFTATAEEMALKAIATLEPEANTTRPRNNWDRPWLQASLGEAFVALGQWEKAAHWYAASADHDQDVGAFQLASSIRQLEEVWQIDAEMPGGGGALIQMLKVLCANKPGGGVLLPDSADILIASIQGPDGLDPQAVLGRDWPAKLTHIRTGIARAQSVAAVYSRGDIIGSDPATGTAFIIEGRHLNPAWGSEPVAITAAHVCSTTRGRIKPQRAVFAFHEYGDTDSGLRCEKVLFETQDGALDYAVLKLKNLHPGLIPNPVKNFDDIPSRFEDMDSDELECRIIGHPDGGEIAMSLANSHIIDLGYRDPDRIDDVYMRYTSPTLGGNSGSPVFDRHWNVIGMHRAGINESGRAKGGIRPLCGKTDTHIANEGVSLKSIAREISSHFKGPTVVVRLPDPSPPPPTTWEALAAAIRDQNVPEATLTEWLQDPNVIGLVPTEDADTNAPADAPLAPEARRDMRGIAFNFATVALSKAFRERRNIGIAAKFGDAARTSLTFVSEGDSWFQYPVPTIKDVIDHLKKDYLVYCRAVAGMEFEKVFADPTDLMAAIGAYMPDGVLLSGGGNDLLGDGVVVKYVKSFDAKFAPADYIEPRLAHKIADIISLYEDLIAEALKIKPQLKFFVHGYDRAIPKKNGRWLKAPLLN